MTVPSTPTPATLDATTSGPADLEPLAIDNQPPPLAIVADQVNALSPADAQQEPARATGPRNDIPAEMPEHLSALGVLQGEEAGDQVGGHFGKGGHRPIVPDAAGGRRTDGPTPTQATLDAAVEAAAEAISRGQGYSLSTMYPGPKSVIQRDARNAVRGALPILAAAHADRLAQAHAAGTAAGAAAERERIAQAIERARIHITWPKGYGKGAMAEVLGNATRHFATIARAGTSEVDG